jgi:hypothetical protein
MKDQFKSLFRIDCRHTFYTDGRCADFSLQPTAETAQLLRSRRSVFRWGGDAGAVIYQLNEAGSAPILSFQTGDALVFVISTRSSELFQITTATELPASGTIKLYSNHSRTVSSGYLSLQSADVKLSAAVLTHKVISNTAGVAAIYNRAGTEITSTVFAAGSQNKELQFDLQLLSPGIYVVAETSGMVTTNTTYYVDSELARQQIFGILYIENNSAYPYDYSGNDAYKLSFTATSRTWNYYMVMPSTATFSEYEIEDKSGGTNRYSDSVAGPITFNRITSIPGSDTIAPMLQSSGKTVVLFQSQQPVSFAQKARGKLQFTHKALLGDKSIVAELPNPDIRKTGTNMFIYI